MSTFELIRESEWLVFPALDDKEPGFFQLIVRPQRTHFSQVLGYTPDGPGEMLPAL